MWWEGGVGIGTMVVMMLLGEEAIFGRAVLHFRHKTAQQQWPYQWATPKISANMKSNYVMGKSNDSLTGEEFHEVILSQPTCV